MLLVVAPFAVFTAWLLIDTRRGRAVEATTASADPIRLRMQQRLTNLVGALLLLGYCVALIGGWLKPRSTVEGIVIATGMIAYVLFSTGLSVRESAGADEAGQIRQLRHALLMLIAFGTILGVAGWMAANRALP